MSARGIIETGTARTQQRYLGAYSGSDPSGTSKGEYWVRTDVTTETDQLAELRIDNGSGTNNAPIFDSSVTLGTDVYVGLRFKFDDGSVGILPVTDQGGAVGSPRVKSDAGTVYESHDALELSAIPDSAIGRWPIDEGSGTTVADAIGTNDLSFSGDPTWTSDANAIGGWKLDLDGNDRLAGTEYSEIATDAAFSVAITVEIDSTVDEGDVIIHNELAAGDVFSISVEGASADTLSAAIADGGTQVATATASLSYDTKLRLVFTFDGSSTGTLYVNASGTASGSDNNRFGATGFSVGGHNANGRHIPGAVDEPIVADAEWTSQQVTDDYDRQPWS